MILPTLSSRRLVGRATELESLHDARRTLSKGRGSVVLVGGEAGIGKTRLLTEFATALSGGRAPLFALGECLADAPRPFGPFRVALDALLTRSPGSFSQGSPLIQRALAALVPTTLETLHIAFEAPRTLEKAELFTGVLHYLAALAAKRATVIALEDLHWADAATLELLAYLAARIASLRLLIVATYRADEIHGEHPFFGVLARLERERTVRRLTLEPLTERETRTLIDEALGMTYSLGPDQIADVIERGEGNPFFTEELLKKALERRLEMAAAALPISIRAMILERLGQLDARERAVLDHAAVFRTRFSVDMLALVMRVETGSILGAVRRFRELNLIVEEAQPPGTFRFRHALTRQTIYDELLALDTHGLHARIVETLESADDLRMHVDELAYHAWKAGVPEATLRYNEQAGDAALAMSAAAQAASYFERALEVAADDVVRERLLGKAGAAYLNLSAFEKASAACLAQHDLLLARGDFDAAAHALTRAAGEFANSGRVHEALSVIDSFLADWAGRLDSVTRDHLWASLARIATGCDDYDRARTALANVQRPSVLPAFSHQVYWLARLFLAQHDLDRAGWRAAADALLARNPETYPLMQSQMLHSIASTSVDFAEHATGERAVDEALKIDRERGFGRAFAFASAVKACILGVQGRLRETRDSILAALAEPDMFVVRLELGVGAAYAAIALGDDELARRLLEEDVRDRVRAAGMESGLSVMMGLEALRLDAAGQQSQAVRLMDEAIEGEQHQFSIVHIWPFGARLANERGLGRLEALCTQRALNPDDRVAHACTALLKAIALRRAADPTFAQHAAEAARRYRALGWPLHEAMALEIAGDGAAALASYRICGSVADVRRLEVRASSPSHKTGSDGLSPREREVAALVARGLTNRAIAEALHIGEKTVEKYVSAIYVKLSFSTRAQLAVHVARGGLAADRRGGFAPE